MNYRHAYHAGNFADVVKHTVLARVLTYMKLKPQPFRVIDTHAGAGSYDLAGEEAAKTGEWQGGIGRLFNAHLPDSVASLLEPYLGIVRAMNPSGDLRNYPGSPVIASRLLRPTDRLVVNELHAGELQKLRTKIGRAANARVLPLDAATAIKSLLPPPERRGVVLIDPAFESPGEFDSTAQALRNSLCRFATGVYIIWYPVKNEVAAHNFVIHAVNLARKNALNVKLKISGPFQGLGLTEAGLLIFNPPYSLKAELNQVMPYLSELLAEGRGAGFSLEETRVSD